MRRALGPLVRHSQCAGPIPAVFQAQAAEVTHRETALLERVGRSPIAEDLARARREEQETSDITHESDCDMTNWDRPDSPGNVAIHRAKLDYDRQALQEAEAAFARAIAGCPAPRQSGRKPA